MDLRKYIIIKLPYINKITYQEKGESIIKLLAASGVDTSNVIVVPNDTTITCIDLPVNSDDSSL